MPASINYLNGASGVRIEPYRVDNLNKNKASDTHKVGKFSEVLKQDQAKTLNHLQKNKSNIDSKNIINNTLNKNVEGKYSREASDLKQKIENNMRAKENEDGTNFALKELSCQYEQQILGILWNLAFSSVDREFEGGLGEELFHKELVNEMIKLTDDGEMGEIAQSIYDDLKGQSNDNMNEAIKRK